MLSLVLILIPHYFLLKIVDPKTGEHKRVTISVDDGIRLDTSMSVLAKLKPAFKKDGSTTAGIISIYSVYTVSLTYSFPVHIKIDAYVQAMLVK